MCGIAGILTDTDGPGREGLVRIAGRMADAQSHRGPDAHGIFAEDTLALAHKRLSILDLSDLGDQPMNSRSSRFTIVYNGEVYNFQELRNDLNKSAEYWQGGSDTEVLLAAIEQWGLVQTLKQCTGMFALALWDRKERSLTLARDRFGEKPLYYGLVDGQFVFSSELKGICAASDASLPVNREALALYLRFQYVPEPYSIYAGIRKLPPGTFLTVTMDDLTVGEPKQYWSLFDAVDCGTRNPFTGSEGEASEHLETLLRQTVKNQLIADVPVGSLLSGGIDSSLITALMCAENSSTVRTFTIGFDDPAYDESMHARRVAKHLGTEHTELMVSPDRALELIPDLPKIWDEPFSDSSQIPTRIVAELTRQHVTVCLSGDGGDEIFAGYNRHVWVPSIWNRIGSLPSGIRKLFAGAMNALSPSAWNGIYHAIAPILPGSLRMTQPGYKIQRLASVLPSETPTAIYKSLASTWQNPTSLLAGKAEPTTLLDRETHWPASSDLPQLLQFLDASTYLPGDIMTKVDRAAMSVSLESRAPFLDHRVAEFAFSLPLAMRIRNGRGKHILRTILDRHVPRGIIDRPKSGFGPPIDAWLRGPLREWTSDLLSVDAIQRHGLVRPEPVRKAFDDHMSGKRDNQYMLWNVVMLQAWAGEWL